MALVLTRRVDDRIFIDCPDGARLEIIVAELRREQVRIAIEAPKPYRIMRAELFDRPNFDVTYKPPSMRSPRR